MKKTIVLSGMLLSLWAGPADAAQGVNLRWNTCFADGGAINRTFACNTNSGGSALVGSFQVGSEILGVTQVEVVVDLATAPPTLPEWWEFKNPGSCRLLALSISAFHGNNCFDWAQGQASMNLLDYQTPLTYPNTARIRLFSVLLGLTLDLAPGNEYTAFRLNISHAGTVGTSCTGCELGACIVFRALNIVTANQSETLLFEPANGNDSHYAMWQGAVGVSVPGRLPGCPFSVPVRNATWGRVKSLYR